MHVYRWHDPVVDKPDDGEEVILWRHYKPLELKSQTGFRSYGTYRAGRFRDDVFHCEVDDVKYWHPLPGPPEGEK